MSLLEQLKDSEVWNAFLTYKTESGNLSQREEEELRCFIEQEAYLDTVNRILEGETFAPPRKVLISKASTQKKRAVYIYPDTENWILKLMAWLLKRYDTAFAPNLYSFRMNRGAKQGIRYFSHIRNIDSMYSYKVDVSNYFNSIDVERVLAILQQVMADEPETVRFIGSLLRNPLVLEDGRFVKEKKGVMAGIPISPFLANVYLMEMDWWFAKHHKIYARYSDDIIVFDRTREEVEQDAAQIGEFLRRYHLTVNPSKESWTNPGEPWTFLGIRYQNGVLDVSPVSIHKLKRKMSRKARALLRWKGKKQVSGRMAAKGFVRAMNYRLYDNTKNEEMTWCRWYFPIINTTDGLHELDRYMQECIRFIVSGKHTKANYNFRYEDMKAIGYRSLVHEYYREKSNSTISSNAMLMSPSK